MSPRAVLVLVITVGMVASAAAQDPKRPDPTPPPRGTSSFMPLPDLEKQPLTPQNFVVRAAIVNMSEMELAQLAVEKSEDPAVKTFAEQLIHHHRAALNDLKQVAIQQNVSVPGTVDEEHRKLELRLSKLSGEEFDQQYVQTMTSEHGKAVALFEAATQAPELPVNLKSYAKESLAQMKEHRKTAESLAAAD